LPRANCCDRALPHALAAAEFNAIVIDVIASGHRVGRHAHFGIGKFGVFLIRDEATNLVV
jgi:hypothetical protein